MTYFQKNMDCFPLRKLAVAMTQMKCHCEKRKFPSNPKIALAFLLTLWTSPLHAQSFDSLLDELSGSEADQIESENLETQKEKKEIPSSTEIISPPEDEDFTPEENIVTKGVTLQGLDKQTARVFIIDAPIGKPIEFGTLKIVVHHCEKAPLEDRQESMAFLTISEEKSNDQPKNLFSGWMFASSPALSCLDHPVYDVWVKECKDLKKKKPNAA